MNKHKEIFTDIYARNVWGGSGGGSSAEVTVEYRSYLQKFMKDNSVKKVLDYGCGDWSFSHLIDWSGTHYFGYDCVDSVIEANKVKYDFNNVHFTNYIHPDFGADLLILKDVLQHWTNEQIISFLDARVKNFKYILVTNTSNQVDEWQDSTDPHINTRPLSANMYPLKKYNPLVVLETNVNEPKETSLITRR